MLQLHSLREPARSYSLVSAQSRKTCLQRHSLISRLPLLNLGRAVPEAMRPQAAGRRARTSCSLRRPDTLHMLLEGLGWVLTVGDPIILKCILLSVIPSHPCCEAADQGVRSRSDFLTRAPCNQKNVPCAKSNWLREACTVGSVHTER